MPTRRLLVAAVTNDALSDQDIRNVKVPSIVNLWATAVNVTDTIGLRQGSNIIMDDGTANVSTAALGMVDVNRDQLVFGAIVPAGTLRVPVATLTASLIFILSVEPLA